MVTAYAGREGASLATIAVKVTPMAVAMPEQPSRSVRQRVRPAGHAPEERLLLLDAEGDRVGVSGAATAAIFSKQRRCLIPVVIGVVGRNLTTCLPVPSGIHSTTAAKTRC